MDIYHITRSMSGEWVFKKAGEEKVLESAATKDALLFLMHVHMWTKPGSVKIHHADGTIEEERTYPRWVDPRRSEG